MRRRAAGVMIALALAAALPAGAQAAATTIGNGTVQVGVTDRATLGAVPCTSNAGVRLVSLGAAGEGVCIGTDIDGWGVADATAGTKGYVNEDGAVAVDPVSQTGDATTSTIVNKVAGAFEVTHAFAPVTATPYLYAATVTVKNLTAGPVDLRYRRTTDWDAHPTEFQERVTLGGSLPAGLTGGAANTTSLSTSNLDPLSAGRAVLVGGDFPGPLTDNGPFDQGTKFDVAPGTLPAGQCSTFKLFWGAAPSEADAIGAVGAAGVTTWALIESNTGFADGTPATWIAGFTPGTAAGPCPSPSPAPTPETPVPPAPAPAPAPAPPALTAASVFSLPATKACFSKRSFRIRLRVPAGVTAKEATVALNGKRVKVVKGARLTAPIDLRGLPKGRFTVKVTLRTTDGRSVSDTRRYRTCAPKKQRRA